MSKNDNRLVGHINEPGWIKKLPTSDDYDGSERQIGFNDGINQVINLLQIEADNHATIATELKEKHPESRPHKYKALALLDFKIYLESLFKTPTIGDINES